MILGIFVEEDVVHARAVLSYTFAYNLTAAGIHQFGGQESHEHDLTGVQTTLKLPASSLGLRRSTGTERFKRARDIPAWDPVYQSCQLFVF